MRIPIVAFFIAAMALLAACESPLPDSGPGQDYIVYERGSNWAGSRNVWRVQADDIVVLVRKRQAFNEIPDADIDIRKTARVVGAYARAMTLLDTYGFSGLPDQCAAMLRDNPVEPPTDAGYNSVSLVQDGVAVAIPVFCGGTREQAAEYRTAFDAIANGITEIVEAEFR